MSRSRIDCSATAANASLISNRSTSAGVLPSRPSALRIALAGCDSSDGSGPATTPCAPISARTGAPSSSAFARDITTTAAAPSEIWLADPAVTVPSAENAGRSLASDRGGGALADALVVGHRDRVTAALRHGHVHDLVVEQPVLAGRGDARSWDWAE